jgi:Ca2+-dependent lipid-binding protein
MAQYSHSSGADSGFVTVTLVSGKGLMGKNNGGTSDPFCIIEIGSEVHFSSIKKENCDPLWNESYVFHTLTPLPLPFYVNISVWNHPKFLLGRDTKGAFLGQVRIDLGHVGPSELNGRLFELEKRSARSHVSGSLMIKFAITSEEDAAKIKQVEKDRALAVHQELQKHRDDKKISHCVDSIHQSIPKVSNLHNGSPAFLAFVDLIFDFSNSLIPNAST